jgi:P27 family predicted phage terminase small subunit
MPRGGHNRKPHALHIVEGTARPGRLNKAEPKPVPKAPTCPGWLLPQARAEWHRLAPELEGLGLLTIADRGCFAGYCQAWARWRQAEGNIAAEGLSIPGHRGVIRKHPLASVAARYLDAMRAFAQEFGLTPQARTRINAPSAPEDDDDEGLD